MRQNAKRTEREAKLAERERRQAEEGYAASLRRDEDRSRRHQYVLDMADYFAGRDTDGASLFREAIDDVLTKNRELRAELLLAGDPLRLRPEHRKVKLAEEKAKKAREKAAKKVGDPRDPRDLIDETIVDPTMGQQKVKSRGYALRGLEERQRQGVERFARDWELAYYRTLKGMPWTPKVDGGGGTPKLHASSIAAQDRIASLKSAVGDRDFRILQAVALYDIGPMKINKAGGPQKNAIGEEIRRVATAVAAFYEGRQPGADKLIKKINELIEAAEREIEGRTRGP